MGTRAPAGETESTGTQVGVTSESTRCNGIMHQCTQCTPYPTHTPPHTPSHLGLHCCRLHLPGTAQWQANCTWWHLPQRTLRLQEREKSWTQCNRGRSNEAVLHPWAWVSISLQPSVSLVHGFWAQLRSTCVALNTILKPYLPLQVMLYWMPSAQGHNKSCL